jgi:ubiquinone/menaquinone biosynthesis C-methylase UbiE
MNELDLIVDLHLRNPRQGPGGEAETQTAIDLCRLCPDEELTIADIGCGTGASALQLAQHFTRSHITAIDAMEPFVTRAGERADERGLSNRIDVRIGNMESLQLSPGSLDLIWSEGAIYNMGFDAGIAAWRPFLKPTGVIAVSELTWTTIGRPRQIEDYWSREYPGIRSAPENLHALELGGYQPLGFFMLPSPCWEANYYGTLEQGFEAFLGRHEHHDGARKIIEAELREINLYTKYGAWYSYGFYIAQRCDQGFDPFEVW